MRLQARTEDFFLKITPHLRHTMINKFKKSFTLRTDIGPSDSAKVIYFQAFVNRQRIRISTELSVFEENWNKERQEIEFVKKGKLNKSGVADLNLRLMNISNRADKIFIDHENLGKYLSPSDFKHLMLSGADRSDFIEFMDKQLRLRKPTLEPSTIKQYNRTFALFKKFKPQLPMNAIRRETAMEFEGFLRKQKLGGNTRAKHHRCLRSVIMQAIEEYGITNPYKGFRYPKEETQREFLIDSEVRDLTALYESGNLDFETRLALGKYLFSCHCGGLRISDIPRVGANSLVGDELRFIPKKTKNYGKVVKIPFKADFLQWVQHSEGDSFFDYRSDQHTNRRLKMVAEIAGISKNLTFHTARHTFATGYLRGGGSVEVLQQILVHGKLETTMVYVHITEERVKEEAKHVQLFAERK